MYPTVVSWDQTRHCPDSSNGEAGAKLLTRDGARIAANIAKLPELLRKP